MSSLSFGDFVISYISVLKRFGRIEEIKRGLYFFLGFPLFFSQLLNFWSLLTESWLFHEELFQFHSNWLLFCRRFSFFSLQKIEILIESNTFTFRLFYHFHYRILRILMYFDSKVSKVILNVLLNIYLIFNRSPLQCLARVRCLILLLNWY